MPRSWREKETKSHRPKNQHTFYPSGSNYQRKLRDSEARQERQLKRKVNRGSVNSKGWMYEYNTVPELTQRLREGSVEGRKRQYFTRARVLQKL